MSNQKSLNTSRGYRKYLNPIIFAPLIYSAFVVLNLFQVAAGNVSWTVGLISVFMSIMLWVVFFVACNDLEKMRAARATKKKEAENTEN